MPVAAPHHSPPVRTLVVRELGRRAYADTWQRMRAFTDARTADSADQVWLVEHPPVYTLGQAGRLEHLHDSGGIPVVHSDRGGQVTYHGPGQVVAYTLFDLRRRGVGVRRLVETLERAVIDLLAEHGIEGQRRDKAPGVYVAGAKVASLGLRVRHGRSFHGLALNVSVDLAPFAAIDPCGYPGLPVTRLADLGGPSDPWSAGHALAAHLERLWAAD
jgi:lipoyl(octanoyl) transferase